MRKRHSLLCGLSLIFLPTGNAAYYDFENVGPDVLGPLYAMVDNYLKGKVTNDDFSVYVDHALSKESNPSAKAEILQHAVDTINCAGVPDHDVEELVIRYSNQLVTLSNRPDVVAQALEDYAVANERKWEASNRKERQSHLLAAMESWIAISKIIYENLNVREQVTPPNSVGGYLGPDNAEFRAMLARQKAELVARHYCDQQNSLLELVLPVKHGMERLKGELNLSDQEFERLWMQVKARNFSGSPAVFRFDRY